MPRLAGRARPSSRQFRPVAGADVIKGQFWLWGRQIARDGGHSIDVEIFGAGGAVHVRVPRRVVFTCPCSRRHKEKLRPKNEAPLFSGASFILFILKYPLICREFSVEPFFLLWRAFSQIVLCAD